jgi:LysM repeat protein
MAMAGRPPSAEGLKLTKQQGSAIVTREHKLALIVGFSLILLVGVLISDHLSSARQAQVGEVGPGDVRVAEVPQIMPREPMRGLEPPAPPGWLDTAPVVDAVPQLPSPIAMVSEAHPGRRNDEPAPVVNIAQGPELSRRLHEIDAGLRQTIEGMGGSIVQRNGIPEIVLAQTEERRESPARPAAAALSSDQFEWHTVQAGDSLYRIAERQYGDGNLWREVMKHNSDRVGSEGQVRAGVRIRLPSREIVTGQPAPASRMAARDSTPPRSDGNQATASRPQPALESGTRQVASSVARPTVEFATYTVKRGDTLGTISQRTLGTVRRMREIQELNGIDDEDHVPVGKVLKIPVSNRG